MIAAYKRFAKWIANRLGGKRIEAAAPKKPLQVSALPAFNQISESLAILPDEGRKLLTPAPAENGELLVGRDGQLSQLDEALNHWKAGHPTRIALVGPQGCGKTSLINCFTQRLQNQSVLRCAIEVRLCSEANVIAFFCRLFHIDPPVDDLETLIERLRNIEPKIVVIERAHNLLLRVIGGRKVIDTFLYTVLCTRQRHLWLIACRRFPWRNMERHANVSQYFSNVIDIDALSENHLRNALTLRLEKSGWGSIYCRSEDAAKEKENQKSDTQKEGADVYYHALYENSGGNLHAALYFLLLCSHYDAGTNTVFLWPPDPLDVTFVKKMDRLHQFTLAELAGHGVLSAEEHGRIFRTVGIHSQMILAHLEQLKLLHATNDQDNPATETVYALSPVIHHAVTSALQQSNLLY